MEKTRKTLTWLFYLLFAVCFTFVIANIILQNQYYDTLYLILVTICVLIGLYWIYKLPEKYNAFLDKQYTKILIIFAAVMFVIELLIGISLRSELIFDIGNINKGAREWVETGSFESFYQYYYYCPNNLAPMAFLYIFFKLASFIGIHDTYAVAVFLLSVMTALTMALVSLTCKKLAGTKSGIFVLVLFALSAQFYIMGAAVYTDAMTMLFPVLIFYLYLISKEKTKARDKIIIYLLMGITAAIGSMLKFTVFIMAIAVLIDMVLNKNTIKDSWKAALCFVGITAIAMTAFNSYIYAFHLDKERAYQDNKPYIHWVMMGLGGNGLYNQSDSNFTDAMKPEERTEKVTQEIIKRVKERGAAGMFDLFVTKSSIDLGDGTYGLSDTINYTPLHETKLRDWVVEKSKHFNKYATYSTAVHISLLIFMLLGAWYFVFRKNKLSGKMLPLYLSIFGLWAFLLLWESNKRYFSNFAPLIFICGTLGIDAFISAKNKFTQELKFGMKNEINDTEPTETAQNETALPSGEPN